MPNVRKLAPLFVITAFALAAVAAVIAFAAGSDAVAPAAGAPGPNSLLLGTGFTYQGELDDGGAAVDDVCDFQFSLWDSATGGAQIGTTDTVLGVSVTAGRFTAIVNSGNVFTNAAFNGNDRWLAIAVRCPAGGGAYTALNPRQALTGTPYAQTASRAGSAPWSGLLGVPPGFADNTDDDTTYSAGNGLMLSGTQFNAQGSPYANVVVVATAGGDYTSVQDALDNINDASANNPYLIWVGPGIYTETVSMEAYVDIEGAGEGVTKITSSGSSTATLAGADNAELRHLTVEHTGGSSSAIAIQNNGTAPRLTHVTATASGGSSNIYAVHNLSGADATLFHVTLNATGTAAAKGLNNVTGSSATLTHVTIDVSGCATSVCYAVDNRDGGTVTMTHVHVTVAAGASVATVGLFANFDSVLIANDVTVHASGGSTNAGIQMISGFATVRDSILTGDDSAGGTGKGIDVIGSSGTYTVTVHNSELYGTTGTVEGDAAYVINIGSTLLSGGAATDGGGALVCAGVFDESYVFYASTCP